MGKAGSPCLSFKCRFLSFASRKARAESDYRATDDLRRLMTPNGKIYSRKRTSLTAQQQAQVAQAIKRARFMSLLPYTSATM